MPQNSHLSASRPELTNLLAAIQAGHDAAVNADTRRAFNAACKRIKLADAPGRVNSAAWAHGFLTDLPVFSPDPHEDPRVLTGLSSAGLKFLLGDRGHGLALVAA